jgi:putative membrane protein
MKRLIAVSILAFVATQLHAQQSGNPAGTAPDTPGISKDRPTTIETPEYPNTVDQLFARQATIGGLAEVELGKLAGQRTQNEAVKRFAQQMVQDHGQANDKLAKIARADKAKLPGKPDIDPDQKALREQLSKLRGSEFDLAYLSAQVGAHQTTAQLLEHEIGSGQDERVKAYAQDTLPTVMRHLEMARSLQMQLVSEAPPPTAPKR